MNLRTLPLMSMLACAAATASPQYDGDNVRYHLISWEELPAALAKEKNALLLDVRSPGEYSDTSHWASLNIGHLKGAKNIEHMEVATRLNELPDRDQPIYLYCSHSQRSRRVSNMLVDSGYTKVFNVNAGMSRYWNDQDLLPMMKGLIERSAGYGIVNGAGLCEMIKQRVFLLDLRADSLFGPGQVPEWVSAYGAIKGSTRIPFDRLEEARDRLPKDRPIVLIGLYTADAAKAATHLLNMGFADVRILFNGLEGMIDVPEARCPCKKDIWSSDAPYSAIGLDQLDTLAILAGKKVMIDIRTQDEYDGTAKESWANMGRFRSAQHMPAAELRDRITTTGIPKSTGLVLVGRGLDEELFNSARALSDLGYKQVALLTTGLWGIHWEAHNLPGKAGWDAWVVNYPASPTP